MIEATIYFERGANASAFVESLRALPKLVQPTYFSEDEGKIIKKNILLDEERFQNFIKENPIGFFLYSENKTCIDISTPSSGYLSVALYLADGLSSDLAVALFHCLTGCRPVFGYACEYVEYKHRNRHCITIGMNNIESWIGRDLDKYIPGVYWYTLLSDRLLAKHSVNIADLASETMVTEILGDGSLHLLKFFEDPKRWKENADRLDDLCERVDGVFSKRPAEAALVSVKSYQEHSSIIDNWR